MYINSMIIKYDTNKNNANIKARGISFDLVEYFEFETAIEVIDNRKDYGEVRMLALGFIQKRLYALVFKKIKGGVRVISLRKANKREAARYEQKT